MQTLSAALSPIFIVAGIMLAGHLVVSATAHGIDYSNWNSDKLRPFAVLKQQERELDIKLEEKRIKPILEEMTE